MHGRLKVKTTAEQKEAKRKEREKKLHLYTGATKKIFQKRQDGEYDHEALALTDQLLSANPDFYTLWNFRRDIFLELTKKRSEEEMQEHYTKELRFLEACLKVNPKSYGSWHHRGWVMDHMPKPDWKCEVALCNQYLEYDERNFHCWDYRRFVVARADIKPAEELKFSDSKISSNFSNYSSWHYRSKLLPVLHPDPENQGRVKEEILLKEYELVQNAFFTDPNDQSAWFYQRWLLGRAERPQGINLLYASRNPTRIVAGFDQPVKLGADETKDSIRVTADGSSIAGTWKNTDGTQNHALVWLYTMNAGELAASSPVDMCVSMEKLDITRHCILQADQNEAWSREVSAGAQLFTTQLSVEKSWVLTQELESCQQLQELEPDNKWCLLTIILLMRAIDPLKYEADTLKYFEELLKTDPYRAGYFQDLRSKFVIENTITRTMQTPTDVRHIDLSGKGLTTLYHMEHMALMTDVNLSSNQLHSLRGCHALQCVRSLLADGNALERVDLPSLSCLHTLSLKANAITTLQGLEWLQSCSSIRTLDVSSNPVCDIPDFRQKLKALLPQLTCLNGQAF